LLETKNATTINEDERRGSFRVDGLIVKDSDGRYFGIRIEEILEHLRYHGRSIDGKRIGVTGKHYERHGTASLVAEASSIAGLEFSDRIEEKVQSFKNGSEAEIFRGTCEGGNVAIKMFYDDVHRLKVSDQKTRGIGLISKIEGADKVGFFVKPKGYIVKNGETVSLVTSLDDASDDFIIIGYIEDFYERGDLR
jgi:hypothetical protein